MRLLAFILFLLGLLVTGVLGTETRLLFFWPGCLLLGLAGLLAGLRWRLKVSFPPSDWCVASVMALALYLAGRAWVTPVASLAREDLFVILGCFVAYVLMVTVVNHPRRRIAVFSTLLLVGVGDLVVGFIHFSGNWSFHVVPHFFRSFAEGRIGGFFNNPNHLAAFFSYVLFLSAGIVCFGRGNATWKLLLGFFVVAFAIGMSLTISRGGLIGLAAGGAVFAALSLWIVWRTQRHMFLRIVTGITVLVVLGGSVLYKVNEEYLRRRIMQQETTTDVRGHVWSAALAQHDASARPLIGDGARSFYDGCFKFRSTKMPGWGADALFAHNEYLQMLVDYGWIGLALTLLVVVTHAANGIRFLHWFAHWKFPMVGLMPSNGVAFTLGSLAALAATMVHAVFEFHWHVAATAITGAVLLGILANPGFQGPEHKPRRVPGVRVGAKLAMIAASLAMIGAAVTLGRADYFAAEAEIAAKDGDAFEQIRDLTRAIEIDATKGETFYRRGLAWMDQVGADKSAVANRRALEKARADLEAAVKLNPNAFLYPLALADAHDGLGDHDAARKMIEAAISLAPIHEEPRLALAIHYNRLREWDAAERAYLWASKASASNLNGTMRWNDGYFAMLKQAARQADRKAEHMARPSAAKAQ